ncbi:RDD family protein [Wenyingzhuangia sp. IMCC45574]
MNYLIRRFAAFYVDTFFVSFIVSPIIRKAELGAYSTNTFVIIVVVQTLYFWLSEYFSDRTLGKKLFKLRVDFVGGKSITKVLIRSLLRFVPFEAFSIFFSKERTMWHDKFSKSRVVLDEARL